MNFSQLPSPVQSFFDSIKSNDSATYANLFISDSNLDDWGKMIKGKESILEFSSSHLLGQNAVFEFTEIKKSADSYVVDGLWKSQAFTGPTRFIFHLENKVIKNLVISSPRWFDRAYIKIKSLF